jgi:hypothetical protein
MRLHHSFDWKGLTFLGKILLACMVVSGAGYFSLLYATGSHATSGASPSLVLIQEMRPAPAKSLSLTLSTTTSEHIIHTLVINDAVPPTGKFIAVDLNTMVLTLYEGGVAIAKYPILAKAESGSPYETPAGFYTVLTKESDHFNSGDQIDLPWSVQFYGNYFIHGWPSSIDGSPVNLSYSGDGIRLNTNDAEKVYDFADKGTGIFVYEPVHTASVASLFLDAIPAPLVSAASYLVADIDTGDVYLEQGAGAVFPAASATGLMAALVANETVPFDIKNNPARTYGAPGFVDWMNTKAKSLDMSSTRFVDTSSTSTENVSTTDDLFRLASYLVTEKSFVLDTAAATKNIVTSIFSLPINGVERHVAIIVLKSNNSAADTIALTDWFTRSAELGVGLANTACITCAIIPPFRKIQL